METLKSDIISTAAALFIKCGLRSVSIDDVCKELRISKKTFYNYFKQKEELIEQVLLFFQEQKKKKAKQPWNYDSEKNIIDVMMGFDKEIKTNIDDDKKHLSLLFDLEKYYPKIFQKRLEIMKQYNQELMKSFIDRGLEEGVFRQDLDIELTSMFISSQLRNIGLVQGTKHKDFYRYFCFFRDVVIRILANEKGMAYYLKNYYKP